MKAPAVPRKKWEHRSKPFNQNKTILAKDLLLTFNTGKFLSRAHSIFCAITVYLDTVDPSLLVTKF